MESFQTPILPSNAPPWPNLHQGSLVTQTFREQYDDRQTGSGQLQPGDDYLDAATDESGNLPLPFAQSAEKDYSQYPLPSYYLSLPPNHATPPYDKFERKTVHGLLNHGNCPATISEEKRKEIQAEHKARLLASRISRCESYLKYRNRQPDKKGKEDVKWPDHIEDVFLRALCRWPPCGRKKFVPPGGTKPMGRNELIADYILMHTGELRGRKQVSSHIQVLKPFVAEEPMVLRFLATPANAGSAARKGVGKKLSSYNPDSRLRTAVASQQSHYTLQVLLDLQPEEFHMYMRRIDTKSEGQDGQPDTSTPLHTYSTTDDSHLAECHLQTRTQLYEHYPELADLPIDRYKYGKFLSLQVPLTLHTQRQLGKAELAISFVFQAPGLDPPVDISSRTRLYKDGVPFSYDGTGTIKPGLYPSKVPFDECQGESIELDEDLKLENEGDAFESHAKGKKNKKVRYYVPFSSKFWADYLWRTALVEHAADDLEMQPLDPGQTEEGRQEAVRAKRDGVSHALNGLTAVQEIVAHQDGTGSQIVMTVHFAFSHASTPAAAITKWQTLDLNQIYKDALSCDPDSKSGSSQDSTGTGTCGSSGGANTLASFDYGDAYADTEAGGASLASPITLQDGATGFGPTANWTHNGIVPLSNTGLTGGLGGNLLPPHTNNFGFRNGAMSLEVPTDPLLLHVAPQGDGYGYSHLFDNTHDLQQNTYTPLANPLSEIANLGPVEFDSCRLNQAFAGADPNAPLQHREITCSSHEQTFTEQSPTGHLHNEENMPFGSHNFGAFRHDVQRDFVDDNDTKALLHCHAQHTNFDTANQVKDSAGVTQPHSGPFSPFIPEQKRLNWHQEDYAHSQQQQESFSQDQYVHSQQQQQQEDFGDPQANASTQQSQDDGCSVHSSQQTYFTHHSQHQEHSFDTHPLQHDEYGDTTTSLQEGGFRGTTIAPQEGFVEVSQDDDDVMEHAHSCPRCADLDFCACVSDGF